MTNERIKALSGHVRPEQTPEGPGGPTRPQTQPQGSPETQDEAPAPDASPAPRTNTPDRETVNAEGQTVTTIKLKRCCNGCGQYVGDLDDRDINEHGGLTDVRGECEHCRPLVELEAAGCRTWELTPREFSRIADEIDRLRPWVFTKGYWQAVDGKLQVVGLRIGAYPVHVVAYFGDWIVRHPDGTFAVHKAPAAVTA